MSLVTDYYVDKKKIWNDDWFEMMFQYGPWARSRDLTFTKTIDPIYDSYHPYCCNTCKRGGLQNLNLLRCAGCKIMKYCCRGHQKKDWPRHKNWCKAYASAIDEDEYDDMAPVSHAEWIRRQNEINLRLIRAMGDLRHNTELQIAGLQPHCRQCYRSGRLPGVDLVICPSCSGVAICKSCLGDKDTRTWKVFHNGNKEECESHLVYLCCSGMIVEQESPIVAASETNCTEMFHPKNWIEYFEKKGNDFDKGGAMPISQVRFMAPVTAFLTECLSMPLTINMLLGKLDLLKKPKLCIHILGAATFEYLMTRVFIELGRLNPQLKRLDLVMVGPNLQLNQSFSYRDFSAPHPSDLRGELCHLDGTIELVSGLYHNSATARDPAPDCFVAFNPGISDSSYFSDWRPTLELIKTRSAIPLCITGFNFLEVENDVNKLKMMGFQEKIPPTPNPFRSMRPGLDPAREETDFSYGNKAFAIVQGS